MSNGCSCYVPSSRWSKLRSNLSDWRRNFRHSNFWFYMRDFFSFLACLARFLIGAAIITFVCVFLVNGCIQLSGRNIPYVKEHAQQGAEQLGFRIQGYEGYEWDLFRGGMVWYTLYRTNAPTIIYDAGFTKWNDEIHIYGLKALNAVSPNK